LRAGSGQWFRRRENLGEGGSTVLYEPGQLGKTTFGGSAMLGEPGKDRFEDDPCQARSRTASPLTDSDGIRRKNALVRLS